MTRRGTLSDPPSFVPPANDAFGIDEREEPLGEKSLRSILVRVRPEARQALKQLALDRDTSLHAVMTEAINDVLVKHGRLPLA